MTKAKKSKKKKPATWGGPREGAGRPAGPDGPSVRVSLRIPGGLLERFDAQAEADGITRAQAHVSALREYLGETDD